MKEDEAYDENLGRAGGEGKSPGCGEMTDSREISSLCENGGVGDGGN